MRDRPPERKAVDGHPDVPGRATSLRVAGITALGIILGVVWLTYLHVSSLRAAVIAEKAEGARRVLVHLDEAVEHDAREAPSRGVIDDIQDRIVHARSDLGAHRILVTDEEGRVIAHSEPSEVGTLHRSPQVMEVLETGEPVIEQESESLYAFTFPFRLPSAETGVFEAEMSSEILTSAVEEETRNALLVGMIVLLVTVPVTAGLVHRIVLRSHRRERRLEQRIRGLVQNSSDILSVVDTDGRYGYVGGPVRRILGYDQEELIGTQLLGFVHPDDRPAVEQALHEVRQQPSGMARFECRLRHADGSWLWAETTVTNRCDDPAAQGMVLNTRDVTDRVKLQEELERLALDDPLTGLANRTLLRKMAENACGRASRGAHFALAMIDLDDFKAINDTLGHIAGDRLLMEVARRLESLIRPSDTVARLGGDEFAILLEGVEDAEGAKRIAGRIMRAFHDPFSIEGKERIVSASIGITLCSQSTDIDALLRDADIAMYSAKSKGKATYSLFDPAMLERTFRHLELRSRLYRAIENEELILHYQPIFDIESGNMNGVEALVRWNHPELGLVPPGEFIPIAEETGLIVPLGSWALQTACRRLERWRKEHPERPKWRMSVNLSRRQLREEDLPQQVIETVSMCNLEPSDLVLEITETAMMDDPAATAARLTELSQQGVSLAVDDFGTGQSSLSNLRSFPVDILKIDRSFVQNVAAGVEDAALVKAIIRLAGALGLSTVAEGVETPEQLDALRSFGCDHAQGFLLSRPVDDDGLDQLPHLLREEMSAQ